MNTETQTVRQKPLPDEQPVIHTTWLLRPRLWLGLLALGLAFWFLLSQAGVLMETLWVLFGALLFSVSVRPLVDQFERQRVPRSLTVIAIFVLLFGLMVLLGRLLVPLVLSEVALIQNQGQDLLADALARLNGLPLIGALFTPTAASQQLLQRLNQSIGAVISALFGTLTSLSNLGVNLFAAVILSYFFTAHVGLGRQFLEGWVPRRYRAWTGELAGRISRSLRRWIWAQLAIALYVMLTFGLGLMLLGVPFAWTIAIVGGALEIVPYLGALAAILLAVLSAITVNPLLILWTILLFIVIVQVKAHIIEPNLYGRVMELHPALVLVALLVGAKAGGILGALFAIPTLVVLIALLRSIRDTGTWFETETTRPPEIHPG